MIFFCLFDFKLSHPLSMGLNVQDTQKSDHIYKNKLLHLWSTSESLKEEGATYEKRLARPPPFWGISDYYVNFL